jgi:ectoine hydroxylase-related dioxygenase (phytanoyl-CoA dioxygenase family)
MSDGQIVACFSRNVRTAAARLAGKRMALPAPKLIYTISVSPTSGPWDWPKPHIDHALKEDAYRTFPPPFRLGCLIYLNDVPSRSGGTVVWPGSHRQLERLAKAHPEDYEYMWNLNRDILLAGLAQPIELTVRAGDVLFYQYLCAHSGSANLGVEPRLALSHKW